MHCHITVKYFDICQWKLQANFWPVRYRRFRIAGKIAVTVAAPPGDFHQSPEDRSLQKAHFLRHNSDVIGKQGWTEWRHDYAARLLSSLQNGGGWSIIFRHCLWRQISRGYVALWNLKLWSVINLHISFLMVVREKMCFLEWPTKDYPRISKDFLSCRPEYYNLKSFLIILQGIGKCCCQEIMSPEIAKWHWSCVCGLHWAQGT